MALNKSLIVYGPEGTGKTELGEKIALHYGLNNVLEEWSPNEPQPIFDYLILTDFVPIDLPNPTPSMIEARKKRTAMKSIDEVLVEMGLM